MRACGAGRTRSWLGDWVGTQLEQASTSGALEAMVLPDTVRPGRARRGPARTSGIVRLLGTGVSARPARTRTMLSRDRVRKPIPSTSPLNRLRLETLEHDVVRARTGWPARRRVARGAVVSCCARDARRSARRAREVAVGRSRRCSRNGRSKPSGRRNGAGRAPGRLYEQRGARRGSNERRAASVRSGGVLVARSSSGDRRRRACAAVRQHGRACGRS